jgi:2'-5' RNA ligase
MLHLIAILAPPAIDAVVKEWKNHMLQTFGCKVALKSPAHMTLIPPVQLSLQDAERLENTLADLSMQTTDFEIRLNNFDSFPPRVIFIHVQENEALQRVQKNLESRLIEEGYPVKKENRPFHPHVTIANRDLKQSDFPVAWRHFKNIAYSATFDASAISLLKHNGSIWMPVFKASLKAKES